MNSVQACPWPRLVSTVILLASFTLYLATLAPTLTWGWERKGVDGGELLTAAHTLGIPHPPGYPTYTMLLRGFTELVPHGDIAYRGNLLSATLAAAAVFATFWAILRIISATGASPRLALTGAALGSSVLATSPLFWSQAVITEVYALNALFASLLLLTATWLTLRRTDDSDSFYASPNAKLIMFGLIIGVGLGNHLTLLAVAVPLIYWIWKSLGTRATLSLWLFIPLLLGLAVYAYLPLRASQHPPINWGNAATLRGAIWILSARPYQEYVFGVTVGNIFERLIDWTRLVFYQFNPLGLFIGLMAIPTLRKYLPALWAASVISIAILSVYSVTYNSFDFEVLMIPVFILFSMWIGIGFAKIASALTEQGDALKTQTTWQKSLFSQPILVLGVLAFALLPGMSLALNYADQDLSDDRTALQHAEGILDAVPDWSVLISQTEETLFSLWYVRYVKSPNRDVAVIAAPLLQFDWYLKDIHRTFPERIPVLHTTRIQEAIDAIVNHNSGTAGVFSTFINPTLTTKHAPNLYEAGAPAQ
jgi:hypothetical protein